MSILLVDSYDSFTYNLRDLLHSSTNAKIITIHNDSYNLNLKADESDLNDLLDSVDAIVIGPGPGSPSNSADIGIIPYIFKYCNNKPILGICLGFQILCLVNDCSVDYLKMPIHGQIHKIDVINDSSIFKNLPKSFESVRYHSIFVNKLSNSIKPLAYYTSPDNEKILMAAQHISNPHYAVQYHPESICSSYGTEVVKNFWSLVTKHGNNDLLSLKNNHLINSTPLIKEFINHDNLFEFNYKQVDTSKIGNNLDILDLCDCLKSVDKNNEIMLLNSASVPGDWSIIGLPINNESDVITHSTESNNIVLLSKWNSDSTQTIQSGDFFNFIANYMADKFYFPSINNEILKRCPFIGGLIGYMSYEEGSFIDINTLKKRTQSQIDDTKLCFIERFICVSPTKEIFVASIKRNDDIFLNNISKLLAKPIEKPNISNISKELSKKSKITIPDKDEYFDSFHKCQEFLHSGDSYELCLTYNTIVQIPNNFNSWDIYKALVKKNPSPYSAYINFDSSLLLSTSPERFISWNSEFCQMRPIKGTLKKNPAIDYDKACELLKIPKELGENLMIVDLIRDNLLFLLDKIEVTKLMSVEEYETIYQLVSVIEGKFTNKFTGIDVLKNSLPAGSMTGAPKKRSVEILQNLEKQERRGLYSGVCGYWSVNNNADWSVIIRSLFSYKDDLNNEEGFNTYRCGAGGALTVLSTDEGEWDEMLVKLHSVLQLFESKN